MVNFATEPERELTRERTMRGKKERARAGLIVGGRVPYGYRYEQGGFIEDPERAPIVRRIFADYESGVSIRGIAKRLRAAGAPTWGGGKWGKSSVARILSNETYAGKAHYGTHRREGKLLRLRDAADRISVPVLALVTREQWERVQGRLAANPQVGRPSSNFLLRGILYCAKCGRKMNGESSRKSRSYRCAGRDSLAVKGERCRKQARIAEVDLAVWSALRRVFSDPEFLQDTLRRRESELRNIEPRHIDDLWKRLGKLRLKEKTVLTAMLDPDLAAERAAIKVLYKAAVEERRRVEAELARIESANQVTAPAVNWVNETAEAIRELMADLTEPATKQEFVRRLVTRAEWDSGEIRMFCVLVPKLSRSRWCCGQFPAEENSVQVIVNAKVAA